MVKYQRELHGFFKDFLLNEDIDRFFQMIEPVEIKSSDVLFDSGQEADGMYFVVSGKMAVQKETGFGVRRQTVALLDDGAPVGEAGLLTGNFRGASVVAVVDSTLLYLSRASFDVLCEEHPSLCSNFFRWLLGRVSMRLKGSTERLAHIL